MAYIQPLQASTDEQELQFQDTWARRQRARQLFNCYASEEPDDVLDDARERTFRYSVVDDG